MLEVTCYNISISMSCFMVNESKQLIYMVLLFCITYIHVQIFWIQFQFTDICISRLRSEVTIDTKKSLTLLEIQEHP